MLRAPHSMNIRTGQRGFTLIELSIAVLIALFLLGGLVTLVIGTRRSSSTQTAVSQLQDNERIAMTMITNIVQKGGYFYDPTSQDTGSFLGDPVLAGVSLVAGQPFNGISNGAAGDALAVRFFAPKLDTTSSIVDCAGQSNATGSPVEYTNVFQIAQDASGKSWLQCVSRTNTAGTVYTINMIPNVTNMKVMYGIASGLAGHDYSIVQYLTTTQMNATVGAWNNLTAVQVTLTFQLPVLGTTGGQMYPASAPSTAATPTKTTFTRVIPIMSRAGVNT
jgi:type IV pilus assembly protein PilW